MADTKTLTTTITARVAWDYRNDQDTSGRVAVDANNLAYTLRATFGDALDKANMIYTQSETLSVGNLDIDLAGGITDTWGTTITFTKVKGIYVKNNNLVAGDTLSVGGAAANPLVNWVADGTDIVVVGPGGVLMLWNPSAAGYAVAGGAKVLRLTATGHTISYDLAVIGTIA